ncbi:hypothetical protein [Proteus mirabilis]|uniref:hypothetical protein n=2 Tax=Proteus mirabilis TaxID=584 RepID=UPI00235FD4F7|nr:hypothetical protein [Proteus mirabilis]MDC9756026.1 hypothetical protein [Proteus mirabilis]MDF7132411.1 hypothetical protein [Proteus mirabilis]MDF7419762.1 hypothetical protein [Proteus mirabilis]HEJ9443788.1 hypothetical protein [Proteus mirabilis]HEJ9562298.1 hypothetical protein [Proteus mirabilis]
MKTTEQILNQYKEGDKIDRHIVSRDLGIALSSSSRALSYLNGLGALVRVGNEDRPVRYIVTNEAEHIYQAIIEERKLGESTYLQKLKTQKAKKRALPTIKWVKHATSNFDLMGKLPTEPYDSLVRTARGNHAN